MAKVKAVRVNEHGGPEVLKWEDVEIGEPNAGEIRLKLKAVGVNFLDVLQRKNLNGTSPPLPFTPGIEGAGIVTAVGPGVTTCKVGDVVAHGGEMGSYAEERILPADAVVPVPSSVDPVQAASVIFKGITTHSLIRRCFKVESGHHILVHAAAGGVGSLLCQWANALGATVIGTVSTKEKAVQAKEDGCHHVFLSEEENIVDRVMEITSGKGVDAVYDSVGKDTFDVSLGCLKKLGYFVHFGNASGVPDPIPVPRLWSKAVYFTSTAGWAFMDGREDLVTAAEAVFANVAKGVLKVRVNHKYPLSQAAKAHADLEGRKTSGSIVLIPDDDY